MRKGNDMKGMIFGVILMVCAGCQSVKRPVVIEPSSETEIVYITINTNQSQFSVEAKWVRYKTQDSEPGISETADVLAAPRMTGHPNDWMTMRVVQIPDNYSSEIKIMLDGEMIEVPNGYGSTLSVKVTPQNNGDIHAKGIFAVAKKDEHFEVPFSGVFELGKPGTIYNRKVKEFDPPN